jgi:hypothetical protein
MPCPHFLGSANGSVSHATGVSSDDDCGDEGTIVSNRWRIARHRLNFKLELSVGDFVMVRWRRKLSVTEAKPTSLRRIGSIVKRGNG